MTPCELCETSKDIYFVEHLWTSASGSAIISAFGFADVELFYLTCLGEDLLIAFVFILSFCHD